MSPMQTRREILRGIATGTAVVGASTGVASARFFDDEAFDLYVVQDASY